ncbi:uncharacterized protein LOC112493810 isoform X1 [Cephus cinctus]|uniref:Uncharacterized protein LOC112493810 isoform X1 n=1 Tax=Cephus cinctus TaxID=211228 RepID=A0AAJ7VXL9_CEPCN|nr:uncharacterized protein LOC112493810 isoform X1 [Cephus cinctus]
MHVRLFSKRNVPASVYFQHQNSKSRRLDFSKFVRFVKIHSRDRLCTFWKLLLLLSYIICPTRQYDFLSLSGNLRDDCGKDETTPISESIRKTCSATRLNLVLCSEYEQRSSQ